MDKYMKIVDGNVVVKEANYIIVHVNGKQVINPSENLIISDGWTKVAKESKEVKYDLEQLRQDLLYKIQSYDKSDKVEGFYIGDKLVWFDREERASLQRRIDIEKKNGINTTTFWYNNTPFMLGVDQASHILDAVELYAIKCCDNTRNHVVNIHKLNSVEELENYNYTIGYPEMLRFTNNED
jgi:hypothetical protein